MAHGRRPGPPADAKEEIAFRWTKGDATQTTDFGSPVASSDVTLRVFDRTGGIDRLVARSTAPKGTGWKAAGASGFHYKSKAGTPDGLTGVVLKSGQAGKAQVTVDGKGSDLRLPTLELAAPVTAEVDTGGACFGATFPAPTKDTPTLFKAKGQ